jgi:prepilin-type N-terminal cleavage/methylation domain-containing protein
MKSNEKSSKKLRGRSRENAGFTLIELLVVMAITIFLLLAAAPLISEWFYSTQVHDAKAKVLQGFAMAKALALRNANGAVLPNAAAGLLIATNGATTSVIACNGSASSALCAIGVASSTVAWSATYNGAVTTAINSTINTSTTSIAVDFDNRGEPMTGGTATLLSTTTFALSRGRSNETGSLY